MPYRQIGNILREVLGNDKEVWEQTERYGGIARGKAKKLLGRPLGMHNSFGCGGVGTERQWLKCNQII